MLTKSVVYKLMKNNQVVHYDVVDNHGDDIILNDNNGNQYESNYDMTVFQWAYKLGMSVKIEEVTLDL